MRRFIVLWKLDLNADLTFFNSVGMKKSSQNEKNYMIKAFIMKL